MKKYCHGNYSEIRITALASLAKSQRRGVASFKKTFEIQIIHPYFFQFWASKKKKMPAGYFFLEIAEISQLPEKKCETPD